MGLEMDGSSPTHADCSGEHKVAPMKRKAWVVVIFPQTITVMLFDSECLVTFQIYFQSFRAGPMGDKGAF